MRFEKLLYEKVVNTQMLKRQRVITSPKKWFNTQRNEAHRIVAHKVFNQGITGAIHRAIEPLLSWAFYKWPREIALQRGLVMEDFWVHNEREQRRDLFTETVWKQSCHPLQPLFFRRRRGRYYKIERAVRGFYVPDYLKNEVSRRTLAETIEVKEEWENFQYQNYYADMTPITRSTTIARLLPLEIMNTYGLLREEAWERYFFNEVHYNEPYTEEELKEALNPFSQYDLNTEEGRRQFETRIHKFVEVYPGAVVPEGESFNFKEFYAKWALVNGKDTSKFDPKLIEELRVKLTTDQVTSLGLPEDKKKGKSITGKYFPALLRSQQTRAIMPKRISSAEYKF